MGFWLPVNATTSARTPGYGQCVVYIYEQIFKTCNLLPDTNSGSVNLKSLPFLGSTGEAVDPNYPSYIMVAETYDATPAVEALNISRNGSG